MADAPATSNSVAERFSTNVDGSFTTTGTVLNCIADVKGQKERVRGEEREREREREEGVDVRVVITNGKVGRYG